MHLMISVKPSRKFIKCIFEPEIKRSYDFPLSVVEVFYGTTKSLYPKHPELESYISQDEKIRAGKFHISEDRDTYISCHGLLRSVISRKIKKKPSEIVFYYERSHKPGLTGNPLYFNMTHVRGAFAFVISNCFYAGIDMENTDRSIDIMPIINTFFSNEDRNYIFDSGINTQEIFSLLWTRKEALLKAIGTGILNNLAQITVSGKRNIIYRKVFDNHLDKSVSDVHYIYSERLLDYYISVAVPQKTFINITQINEENIISFLS
jgi:phosphopantetheinyl transferase